jgi:hypothetical protein
MKDTLALWEQFEQGMYDIYLSQVTLDELGECLEPKRGVRAITDLEGYKEIDIMNPSVLVGGE